MLWRVRSQLSQANFSQEVERLRRPGSGAGSVPGACGFNPAGRSGERNNLKYGEPERNVHSYFAKKKGTKKEQVGR